MIRREEYFAMPFDDPEPSNKVYDFINDMIEETRITGKRVTEDDILDVLKVMDPEAYEGYLRGEIGFDDG